MKQVPNTKSSLVSNSHLHHSIYPPRSFSKYCLILLLAGISLFISSCKKEDICKKTVPFKAEFNTNSPSPNIIIGTGKGTPIGKSTFILQENDANFPLLTGTATITAENGDEIYSTHTGSVVGPDSTGVLLITENNIITGGTGRFAGATGSFIAHGIASINVPTGSATFDGTIILDECHGKQSAH
ncbi:MAG: hypothetical protein M3015_13300 [Bacteroidota bacterium]|nr:hypothetical protein [Bacteroidota bacterium]